MNTKSIIIMFIFLFLGFFIASLGIIRGYKKIASAYQSRIDKAINSAITL